MEDHFTIDIHTHIIPEKMPDFKKNFGYGGFISLSHHKSDYAKMMIDHTFFREIHRNCWDPVARIAQCNLHKVDVQVLSTIPILFNYWAKPKDTMEVAMFLNDHIAGISHQYPDRFIGLGTLPMQAPDLAIKELERCCNDLKLAGIQIGSHINEWNLDDPNIFPVFEAAQDLGASVFIHPWDMMGKDKMQKYWLPWLVGMPAETSLAICSMLFGGVLEKLPDLKVAFAHGGGSFPATIGRIEHGFNVRPDLCAVNNNINPKAYLGKFYTDSITHDSTMLKYLTDLIGDTKIMLGTDYPFPLGELEPGKLIREMEMLNDTTKIKLLSTNALDWLGLEHDHFEN